ncbi:mitochondrial cardiolipin hydrolase-like [Euwallacea fornicatus]|uniref:mitochondrial cardiolipin hydrolase-like n=1 Tax=Euwallacea fornicatus TaxID=995702 RepID=UPI00338E36C1
MDYTFRKELLVSITVASILSLPLFSFFKLYKSWLRQRKIFKEKMLFHQRHNCIVTYRTKGEISGWPGAKHSPKGIIDTLFNPIIYFIQTANESIDIAVMLVNVHAIFDELSKAKKRGIKIRILCNFRHIESMKNEIRKLQADGVEFQFFVSGTGLDSIMHHKFILKDYTEEGGFLCTGSLNFSSSSVVNNYEHIIFLSCHHLVSVFQTNFNECWKNFTIDNKGLVNKTILKAAEIEL